MAITLGKRKRAVPSSASAQRQPQVANLPPPTAKAAQDEEDDEDSDDMRDAFRRAFEAKFKPLPEGKKKAKTIKTSPADFEDGTNEIEDLRSDDEDDDNNEDEEDIDSINSDDDSFDGLSDNPQEVEIIDHAQPHTRTPFSREEKKAFMTSRPPSSSTTSITRPSAPTTTPSDTTDSANLANDLALQRLLRESHLLSSDSTTLGPEGRNRHRAVDLRMQTLGSKKSILEQKHMPMSHRKGIKDKAASREETRRREAKENGIVLERATAGKSEEKKERRERGVGGPSVGRMKGGTLVLSRRDVDDINGPRGGGGRGGRGARGRGGGRGRGRGRGGKR